MSNEFSVLKECICHLVGIRMYVITRGITRGGECSFVKPYIFKMTESTTQSRNILDKNHAPRLDCSHTYTELPRVPFCSLNTSYNSSGAIYALIKTACTNSAICARERNACP